jgi:hypothetical protein
MIDALQNYLAAALILVGSGFALTASVGLLRLPALYTRVHAASKAGTLGPWQESCFSSLPCRFPRIFLPRRRMEPATIFGIAPNTTTSKTSCRRRPGRRGANWIYRNLGQLDAG